MGLPFKRQWQESISVPPVSSLSLMFLQTDCWPQCCYASTAPPVYFIHATLPCPCCCGFLKEPKTGLYSCSTSGERKKEQSQKNNNNHKMLLHKFSPIILVFLSSFKKRVCFLSVSCPFPLGLCHFFSGFMYIRMKALQKTCFKKKKDEYEKRSFYSDELLLCSPLHLALHFLTTHQENQTWSASRHCPESLPLLGERLILDHVHVGFSFKIVQCNSCVQVTVLLFSLFFQLVPSLYQYFQNRIEKNNTHTINLL